MAKVRIKIDDGEVSAVVQQLRHIRLENQVSQQTLTEITGIKYQQIGQWELGHNSPTLLSLESWAAGLNQQVMAVPTRLAEFVSGLSYLEDHHLTFLKYILANIDDPTFREQVVARTT